MKKLMMLCSGLALIMIWALFIYAEDKIKNENPGQPIYMVYYFYGNYRCTTCMNMEKWTQEVVNVKFKTECKNDTLKFAAINYETKENESFAEKYPLTNKHIILSQRNSKDKKSWRELDKIWYVAHDENLFKNYLEKEIRNFLMPPGTNKKEQ